MLLDWLSVPLFLPEILQLKWLFKEKVFFASHDVVAEQIGWVVAATGTKIKLRARGRN